jgi:hypothetical protein
MPLSAQHTALSHELYRNQPRIPELQNQQVFMSKNQQRTMISLVGSLTSHCV